MTLVSSPDSADEIDVFVDRRASEGGVNLEVRPTDVAARAGPASVERFPVTWIRRLSIVSGHRRA